MTAIPPFLSGTFVLEESKPNPYTRAIEFKFDPNILLLNHSSGNLGFLFEMMDAVAPYLQYNTTPDYGEGTYFAQFTPGIDKPASWGLEPIFTDVPTWST